MKVLYFLLIFFFSVTKLNANGLNIYGIGLYDVKFDGSEDNQTSDFRYERRLEKAIIDIGPEEDNFFFLKPFFGFEYTGDAASYIIAGIYLDENFGQLFSEEKNRIIFTPSFGLGYYDDGSGKKLGNDLQFRTTLEFSYELENKNRLGLSFGHISNANLGDKNPGVEILSLSYQVPY